MESGWDPAHGQAPTVQAEAVPFSIAEAVADSTVAAMR